MAILLGPLVVSYNLSEAKCYMARTDTREAFCRNATPEPVYSCILLVKSCDFYREKFDVTDYSCKNIHRN